MLASMPSVHVEGLGVDEIFDTAARGQHRVSGNGNPSNFTVQRIIGDGSVDISGATPGRLIDKGRVSPRRGREPAAAGGRTIGQHRGVQISKSRQTSPPRHVPNGHAETLVPDGMHPTSSVQDNSRTCTQVNKQGNRLMLNPEEVNYARCPPGEYLSHHGPDAHQRASRLRAALCAAKARGWKGGNPRESANYLDRGYATFESGVWPKHPMCNVLPNELWNAEFNAYYDYRADTTPQMMTKYVSRRHNQAEFHQNWKVASTSFPEYLRCEYGADTWMEVPVSRPVGRGAPIIAAVRNPLARWLSAASELLERSLNHWCPRGPCTEQDAFYSNLTLTRIFYQTSWYKLVDPASGGYTREKLGRLVRAMVHDTKCNYYTYAAEHLNSQAGFVTQNRGEAQDISVIIKLEHLAPGLNEMADKLGLPNGQISGKCNLEMHNRGDDKPNMSSIPTASHIMKVLLSDADLLQDLCLTYAQDFVCFDYELPEGCQGLF